MNTSDIQILRELAQRYLDRCRHDLQAERRDLGRRHNSLIPTRPLIYLRAFAWREMAESQCRCEDPVYRTYEDHFRRMLYWAALNDDSIFEPWVTVQAACVTPPEGIWGLPTKWITGHDPRGAKRMNPPIVDLEDAQRMVEPHHIVDENETDRRFN